MYTKVSVLAVKILYYQELTIKPNMKFVKFTEQWIINYYKQYYNICLSNESNCKLKSMVRTFFNNHGQTAPHCKQIRIRKYSLWQSWLKKPIIFGQSGSLCPYKTLFLTVGSLSQLASREVLRDDILLTLDGRQPWK